MYSQKNRTYSQIDLDERRKIERWHAAKISVDVIAEKLGRHRSTIFRELKRNKFADPEMRQLDGYYCLSAPSFSRGAMKYVNAQTTFMNVGVANMTKRDFTSYSADLLSALERQSRAFELPLLTYLLQMAVCELDHIEGSEAMQLGAMERNSPVQLVG
jgi:hypothetical protein